MEPSELLPTKTPRSSEAPAKLRSGEGSAKPRNNYVVGREFEYKCQNALRDEGYIVVRSSGSHGAADLVALLDGQILFVQCKTAKAGLGKKERGELIATARVAGALPVLSYKGVRGKGVVWVLLSEVGDQEIKIMDIRPGEKAA